MGRQTPAKKAISEFLNSTGSPVDIEQIIEYLRSKNLKTNKVTVYRIIEHFYKEGIVTRLELGEGKFRYELNRNHHHHLICQKCGKIEDFKDVTIQELEKKIFKQRGFLVKYHSLEFFGICKNCQL